MDMTKDQLRNLDWRAIKEYATSLGFEKAEDLSWHDDEVLDVIVALADDVIAEETAKQAENTQAGVEQPKAQTSTVAEASDPSAIASPSNKEASQEYVVKGKYATETFKRRGLPYCQKCGAQYQHGLKGEPICPEAFPAGVCPRIKIEKGGEEVKQNDFMDL